MSIKGTDQELYVGKTESNIISFLGKKTTIVYSELDRIDFSYFRMGKGGGYVDFINKTKPSARFCFNYKSNEKISRAIDLIKDNNPDLDITEYRAEDYKFYQCDWFYTLMLFLCFPVGLFLMWYYKKLTLSMRTMMTMFFVFMWALSIYVWCPRTYNHNITLDEYNQCQTGMSYQECVEIIGGEAEPLAETNILDMNSSVYVWYGGSDGISNATLYFTNGKLTTKAQMGLK